jgi:hypothetical protein
LPSAIVGIVCIIGSWLDIFIEVPKTNPQNPDKSGARFHDMENTMRTANAVAIAGGAVSVALIDFLIESKFLAPDNARAILTEAKTRLQPFMTTTTASGGIVMNTDATEAARIIGELYGTIA